MGRQDAFSQVLPSKQIRTVREYAVSFSSLITGSAPATAPGQAADPAEALKKLGDLLKKKK